MIGHYYSVDELKFYIESVFYDIQSLEPKSKCVYYADTDKGETVTDVLHPYGSRLYTPYKVGIGFKSVYDNMVDNRVRNEDAVKALKAVFHEKQHVVLTSRYFQRTDLSDSLKQIARVSVASKFFPEYYDSGYFCNPEEIMCELRAFESLEEFFEEHPVNFDWRVILVEQANNNYDFINHARDFEDLKNQYARKVSSSYYDSRINGSVLDKEKHSASFLELRNRGAVVDILNAPDGVKEVELVNKYIGKYHPEYFRGYQCIKSEYCIKNIVNKKERLVSLLLDITPDEKDDVDDFQLD